MVPGLNIPTGSIQIALKGQNNTLRWPLGLTSIIA
jgi:hypothetical protein